VKCEICYADNPAWQTVCSACGSPARPLQLCPAGRLLAVGASRCDDCPARWPEVTGFAGHPLLRGVVRVDGGRLSNADGTRNPPYLELRDQERPYALAVEGPGRVRVLEGDPVEASVKLLVRPGGTRFCAKPTEGQACVGLEYDALPATGRVVSAGAALQFTFFEVPEWVESR
jgi:hypothetical protein